ncbi:hypothetical protein EV702DRAFT_1041969 [Suillus placidus]|uniref:Uncharacterized protein n=1 Tax=Suillus placidus TaxID=48579 RepID=A0A9P7A2V1_9AGAM|nr:hypothetical protein EV702DRAFT_1041969 [Suillus placidus]
MASDGTTNVHRYMTSATMLNVADDFSQRVKAAMIFDEYVEIEKDGREGPTKGYIKNNIMMLRELVAKLMKLAQEAGGDIEYEHEGKCNADYLQAAKGGEESKEESKDEQSKDLTLVQYM